MKTIEKLVLKETPNPVKWFSSFAANTDQKFRTKEILSEFLCKVFGKDESITFLDVGCSTADLSKYLCERLGKERIEFHGIDTEKIDLKKAEILFSEYGRKEFYHGNCFAKEMQNKLPSSNITLISHVGYYAKDVGKFATVYANKLPNKGTALFIHDDPNSDTNQLRTQFGANIQLNTSNEIEKSLNDYEIKIFPYKSLLKFPDNMKDLWEPLGQTSPSRKVETHQPNFKLAKNLLEFIVQRSLEDLQENGLLDSYLTKVREKLQKQDNCLNIISRLDVVIKPQSELSSSKKFEEALNHLSCSIKEMNEKKYIADIELVK